MPRPRKGVNRAKFSFFDKININKTRTSKVGAISKAQKAQNIFFGKKLVIFEKKFFQKKSHSTEKCRRGDPLGLINIHSVAKFEKTRRGDPFETLNFFSKKKSHRAENTVRRAYPLVPLSFLDDVKILLRKLLRQYFKCAK